MVYRTRPIHYLHEWAHRGWRMKVYGISAWSEKPPDALVEVGQVVAAATLPPDATSEDRYGVGLLGVHDLGGQR